MSRADDLADIESGLLAMRGRNNVAITAAKALKASETGFLLIDATAAGFTVTLPPANRIMDVRVQRVDNSGNRLVIQAYGAEKVLFHTHLRPEGYPFFVLMGAGDFWHLRSDANGAWRVLDRLDATPLGRPVFETTTAFQPGGWGAHNGFVYNRSEWPWVWDHAQASGMLTTEALRSGNEGSWTSGDGVSTFRSPDGRGEFLRLLDEARGVDISRLAGSNQVDAFKSHNANLTALWTDGLEKKVYMGGTAGVTNSYVVAASYTPAQNGAASGLLYAKAEGGVETRPRNIAYPGRLKLI
ncbi:phage tail protein [Pseudomonas gingeri]|uniref:phage tail protein n=1 Tax=Pseudomonas gingeri TaxID=117681 RepID=UPI0015A00F73|nr:phage tail protein [Pseudomonas gingeri]NWA11915.1 phage tail protein [Pseudomonas gingeri]